MNYNKYFKRNFCSLKGKTVAISGATGGIGKELCRHLLSLNARLILLDRNYEKSHALKSQLLGDFKDAEIKLFTLDLEDMCTVKVAASYLKSENIDYLLLNAGAYHIPRHLCETGFDNVFQINFISPYYLAHKLKETVSKNGGRIVAVGSIAHNYSRSDINNIDFRNIKKSSLAYGNAKRWLMFSLYELFKDSDTLAITHPGITFTNITAHYPKLIFAIIKHPMKIIFMKPRRASLSILSGIFNPTRYGFWIGPKFFNVWGNPSYKRLKSFNNDESTHLFKIAEEIYNKF